MLKCPSETTALALECDAIESHIVELQHELLRKRRHLLHLVCSDIEVSAGSEPGMVVASTEPEVVVASTEPEVVVVASTEPEVVVVASTESEVVVVASTEPEVVVVASTEPEVVVASTELEVVVASTELEVVVAKESTELQEELNVDGEEDGEDMEVEERVHNGKTYYVEPNSGDIYDIDTGDVIGSWEGDTSTGFPTIKN